MTWIEKKLHTWLTGIIEAGKYDRVLAVQKKGVSLARLVESTKSFRERIYFLDAIELIDPNKLRHEKLLLFDDTVDTGQTLNEALGKIPAGVKVDTAAFIMRDRASLKPTHPPQFVLNPSDYARMHYLMRKVITSLNYGRRVSDDHLTMSLRFKRSEDSSTILRYLGEFGQLNIVDSPPDIPNVHTYTLDDPFFFNWTDPNIPGEMIPEGSCKVRLFEHTSGLINCVPRVYPAIRYGTAIPDHEDGRSLIMFNEVFSRFSSVSDRVSWLDKSAIFNVNLLMGIRFWSVIKYLCKKHQVEEPVIKFNDGDFCAFFGDEGQELAKRVSALLHSATIPSETQISSMRGPEQVPVHLVVKRDKLNKSLMMHMKRWKVKREFLPLFDSLRYRSLSPAMKMHVHMHARWRHFFSFSQLVELMRTEGIGEPESSVGIDFLFDRDEMRSSRVQFGDFKIRAYSPPSEVLHDELKLFLRI